MHQTESQAIGREGERWFVASLPPTWIFQRPSEDIGIDGVVVITDDDDLRGAEVRVQVKASQHWSIDDGKIKLRGIPRKTVSYWTFGLTPTAIVLYDQRRKIGWVALVWDIVLDTESLITDTSKTCALSVPLDLPLTSSAWPILKERLRAFYTDLLGSFDRAKEVFAAIHTLSQCLRALQMIELFDAPDSQEAEMMNGLMEVIAHRDAVLSLIELRDAFSPASRFARAVDSAAVRYRDEVATFIPEFERVLANKNSTIAIRTNHELMKKQRRGLLMMLTDLIVSLSSRYAKKNEPKLTSATAPSGRGPS